jgi:predicted peptidase
MTVRYTRFEMKPLLVVVFASIVTMYAAAQSPAAHETGFLNRSVSLGGEAYRFQVYVPHGWTPAQRLPVILFLHGGGERGDDGLAQTQVGIGAAIRLHLDRYPAIVVMPQVRKDLTWQDPAMDAMAIAALEQSAREFGTDPERVYVTGMSMGGYGSWAMLVNHPNRFAAGVIICSGVAKLNILPAVQPETASADIYTTVAAKIGPHVPLWLFHGDADMVVPVEGSRRMTDALQRIGSSVKYTEYPGVTHNSWDRAYADPEMPAWLFAQRLSTNAAK